MGSRYPKKAFDLILKKAGLADTRVSVQNLHTQEWKQKVESIMLTEEQREKVLYMASRHEETLLRLDQEMKPYHLELEALLPNTIGIEPSVIQSCIRSDEVMELVKKYASRPVKFFSKLNYFIFGYFDPTNIYFDNKNKYLLG